MLARAGGPLARRLHQERRPPAWDPRRRPDRGPGDRRRYPHRAGRSGRAADRRHARGDRLPRVSAAVRRARARDHGGGALAVLRDDARHLHGLAVHLGGRPRRAHEHLRALRLSDRHDHADAAPRARDRRRRHAARRGDALRRGGRPVARAGDRLSRRRHRRTADFAGARGALPRARGGPLRARLHGDCPRSPGLFHLPRGRQRRLHLHARRGGLGRHRDGSARHRPDDLHAPRDERRRRGRRERASRDHVHRREHHRRALLLERRWRLDHALRLRHSRRAPGDLPQQREHGQRRLRRLSLARAQRHAHLRRTRPDPDDDLSGLRHRDARAGLLADGRRLLPRGAVLLLVLAGRDAARDERRDGHRHPRHGDGFDPHADDRRRRRDAPRLVPAR